MLLRNTMKSIKTLTIGLPLDVGKELTKLAKEEKCSIPELITELVRRYSAHKTIDKLVKKGTAYVKKMKLTPEDFGGPFED